MEFLGLEVLLPMLWRALARVTEVGRAAHGALDEGVVIAEGGVSDVACSRVLGFRIRIAAGQPERAKALISERDVPGETRARAFVRERIPIGAARELRRNRREPRARALARSSSVRNT